MATFCIILTHFSLAFIPTAFIFFVLEPSILFFWHPTCMLIAFVFIMSEGIIIARHINSNRTLWSLIHYWLQISCLVICFLGFIIIFYTKTLEGKPHFQSWHSGLGLLVLICTFCQVMLGLRIYYTPQTHIPSIHILGQLKNLSQNFWSYYICCFFRYYLLWNLFIRLAGVGGRRYFIAFIFIVSKLGPKGYFIETKKGDDLES